MYGDGNYTPSYSTSTNSSMISLSLSPQGGESASVMSPLPIPGNTRPSHVPCNNTASRSEKAIAALTLAMANGAAGINDYEALRLAEGLTALDATHAGELWN